MPAVHYTLSRKQAVNRAEVLVRFYHAHINQRAKTGITVPVSLWDAVAERCTVSRRYETPDNAAARKANAKLDTLAADILAAFANRPRITDGWLQKIVSGEPSAPPLFELVPRYCVARNVAPATARKMQCLANHLQRYGEHTRAHIYAHTLTANTLEQFAMYLRQCAGLSQNSVSGRLRQLRTLLYWIGKPAPNPFDNYTIPADAYGTPIYLTKQERDMFAAFEGLSPAKAVQRDIFIFQCHTGCRISDLYHLTPANISNGWLVYIPRKITRTTPRTVEVPLTKTAAELAEKYKGQDLQGRLFPLISEPKYNAAVQAAAKQAGLNRSVMVFNPLTYETTARPLYEVITSHTARKTFTQIAYATTGDKRLVASMTGHSETSRAFNRYSEITRDMKEGILERLQ